MLHVIPSWANGVQWYNRDMFNRESERNSADEDY